MNSIKGYMVMCKDYTAGFVFMYHMVMPITVVVIV